MIIHTVSNYYLNTTRLEQTYMFLIKQLNIAYLIRNGILQQDATCSGTADS